LDLMLIHGKQTLETYELYYPLRAPFIIKLTPVINPTVAMRAPPDRNIISGHPKTIPLR